MLEFGVDASTMKTMETIQSIKNSTAPVDSRPCFVFAGQQFEHDEDFKRCKSLLLGKSLSRDGVGDGDGNNDCVQMYWVAPRLHS